MKRVAAVGGIWLLTSCTSYEIVPPRIEPRPAPTEAEVPATPVAATPAPVAATPSPAAPPSSPPPRGLRTAATSASWTGTWEYFDQGPKIGLMVASIGHSLEIHSDRTARYTSVGYQADAAVECDVEEKGETIRVIARRNVPGEDGEQRMISYPPGTLLVVLRSERGRTTTRWEAVEPAFGGCPSGSECFKKDK